MTMRIETKWLAVGLFVMGLGLGSSAPAFSEVSPPLTAAAAAPREHGPGYACAHGKGVYARLTNGRLQTSENKITWNDLPLVIPTFLRGITYGNGLFVAVGGSYVDEPGVIMTSRDGHTWIRRNVRNKINLSGVTYNNGLFVAVGDAGTILTSTDGVAWKTRNSGTAAMLAAVASGKGILVAGGESGTILTSTDGVHWTSGNWGASVYVGKINCRAGVFVAASSDVTFASTDGVTWQRRELETTEVTATASTQ